MKGGKLRGLAGGMGSWCVLLGSGGGKGEGVGEGILRRRGFCGGGGGGDGGDDGKERKGSRTDELGRTKRKRTSVLS